MKYLKAITVFLICIFSSVYVFADGRWTHIQEITGYTVGIVRSVAVGPDVSVWFAGDKGLFRYSNGRWDVIKQSNIGSIAVGSDGAVWLDESKKLLKYNNGEWVTYTLGNESSPKGFSSLSIAPDGSIWGVCYLDGVYHFDGNIWTSFTTEDGLFHNYVTRLTVGPDGHVWVRYGDPIFCEGEPGCIFGGVSRFDGEHWETFDVKDGLLLNAVFAIAVDQNGNVCVSYEVNGGISLYNGETWETLSSKWGGALAFGPDGVLWNVDIYGVDLRNYVDGRWTTFKDMPDVTFVYDIAVDNNSTVWLGTSDGIIYYEPSPTNVENKVILNDEIKILGNYPNPFNPITNIEFSLPHDGIVDISIFSLNGQRIKRLVSERFLAGKHSLTWDGTDNRGKQVASGVYVSCIKMNTQIVVHKIMLFK